MASAPRASTCYSARHEIYDSILMVHGTEGIRPKPGCPSFAALPQRVRGTRMGRKAWSYGELRK